MDSKRNKVVSATYQLVRPDEIREVEAIREVKDGQVAVQPTLASICHADLRYYTGQRRPEAIAKKLPMALLHEGIGTVVASGSSDLVPGQRSSLSRICRLSCWKADSPTRLVVRRARPTSGDGKRLLSANLEASVAGQIRKDRQRGGLRRRDGCGLRASDVAKDDSGYELARAPCVNRYDWRRFRNVRRRSRLFAQGAALKKAPTAACALWRSGRRRRAN